MPQLFVVAGSLVGRTFALEDTAVLGRGQDAGVRLPDASVSRAHARIERDADGGWSIVDLGSRNGVRKNGERVERARLVDLDEIALGELVLRFRAEPAASAAAPADAGAGDDGGFELEEEIDLGATRAAPRAPLSAAARAAPAAPAAPAPAPTARDLERARILAEAPRGGVLGGDLAQWPWALRWTAYLVVVAAAAALCFGAYYLVTSVRGAG